MQLACTLMTTGRHPDGRPEELVVVELAVVRRQQHPAAGSHPHSRRRGRSCMTVE